MEHDEIIFSGAYKDFKMGLKFDLGTAQPNDVAFALGYVSSGIEPWAFRFSGMDTEKIAKFAEPQGNGLAAIVAFLEATPPAVIKENLLKAIPRPELMAAAESYLINQLFRKAGVPFTVSGIQSPLQPEKEEAGDVIAFIGKYKEWVAVKKLSLEKVQDYEVSGILCSINHTVVNKAFDFSGWKTDAGQVPETSKRKSFGSLVQSLRGLQGNLGGRPDDAYRICKTLEGVGFKPYASPEMLTEAYPDIKPPKVRGRKPKG